MNVHRCWAGSVFSEKYSTLKSRSYGACGALGLLVGIPQIIAHFIDDPLDLIDNIGNRDYLQVLAYMFRFDAKAGYYLYPEAEGTDDLKLWMNRGSTYEKNVAPRDDISVTKHGLKIPVDVSNYDEFVMRMKICEQEFKSTICYNTPHRK